MPDLLRDITPRDLFMSPDLPEEVAARYLGQRGFRDGGAADEHLQQLAEDLPTRLALGDLAALLLESLAAAADPDAALVGFCRYVSTRVPKSSLVGYLHDDPRALHVLTTLLGASPFLSQVLVRNPEYFHWLRRELDGAPPDRRAYDDEIAGLLAQDTNPKRRIEALKRFQRREILRIAGRDLLDKDTLRSTTEQISTLADAVIDGTVLVLRDETAAQGRPLPGTFAVIGMGKLGGRELNYSSDVDLIYVYGAARGDASAHEQFQRFGRALTKRLGEHTDEGYLYRVDLRLRPMGSRGDIAYSVDQGAQYYETLGETFERFAMIKARPVAGDQALGDRFVEMVQPFVYRRYLDHAAIEELARYKRRADREHARGDAAERNVKSGRGGIREIELFTQVFQLLWGGTHDDLRQSRTLAALQRVQAHDLVEGAVVRDLTAAYEFLRRVEHRLQLVQEGQTHMLSGEHTELLVTARRMGFETTDTFLDALEGHRTRVHEVYADLFERRQDDADFEARQLFRLLAGELSDEDAAAQLARAGVPEPERALEAVRALDEVPTLLHSRTALRNLLANLLAEMLETVAASGAPLQVLTRLEHVVARAGAPAALYKSLLEDAALRRRLVTALDTGDLFARRLGRYPELLDFLVPAALDAEEFSRAITRGLDAIDADDTTQVMGPFRRVKAIEEFKVLVEWLESGALPPMNRKLSVLADAALGWACARAERKILSDGDGHASPWVVFALGKLGGQELTVHSDLDLVFLYEGEPSDARLYERQQAFVRSVYALLETRTPEGIAYEVDTRLRPEGKKGALTIPLSSFARYLDERAEPWERMAWTRARVVAGSEALGAQARARLDDFVYGAWDDGLPAYAAHLRQRMERELSKEATGERLDLKIGRGGLADIDFLLQLLQIRKGAEDSAFRVAGTRALLSALPATDVLTADEIDRLRQAYELLRSLETVLRIESDAGRGWIPTTPEALDPLARRLGLIPPTGQRLLQRYREATEDVRAVFETGMSRLGA